MSAQVEIVENPEGGQQTPVAVCFKKPGQVRTTGKNAMNQLSRNL